MTNSNQTPQQNQSGSDQKPAQPAQNPGQGDQKPSQPTQK